MFIGLLFFVLIILLLYTLDNKNVQENLYGNVSVLTCNANTNGETTCIRTDLGNIDVPFLDQKAVGRHNFNAYELKDSYDLWKNKN
jgi:hypothetical protein